MHAGCLCENRTPAPSLGHSGSLKSVQDVRSAFTDWQVIVIASLQTLLKSRIHTRPLLPPTGRSGDA